MDSKQFNRIRSNAMAEASMEHRNRLKEINKLNKELDSAGDILAQIVEIYGLKDDNGELLPYDEQPTYIQHAMQFTIEVAND